MTGERKGCGIINVKLEDPKPPIFSKEKNFVGKLDKGKGKNGVMRALISVMCVCKGGWVFQHMSLKKSERL